ncbi:MAG: hypothetical protein IT160_07150 [Bryobacterales bacterium]|nr:hypothetical protein [Bryobacterales bacterium]
MNPATGQLRPAYLITDRAKRYRAQANIERTRKLCIYCGAPAGRGRRLDVEHIDGDESNSNPNNLAFSCRPCNVRKANVLHSAGIGKKTAQYNPRKAGARSLGEWIMAVSTIQRRDKRTGRLLPPDQWKAPMMPLPDAIAMVRATPPERRSEFSSMLRAKRSVRRRSRDDVPF